LTVVADWKARLPVLSAALWWGSLSAVGFLVVPLLFANAASPAQAGQLAARLFSAQTWVGLGCGLVLLMAARTGDETPSLDWGQGALVYVLFGMLLALLQEFAVAPRIVQRQNLALWHSAGTALVAAQWLCALVVLWKVAGRK
jgi:hypothetical protein